MSATAAPDQAWMENMRAGQLHFKKGDLPSAARAFIKATKIAPGRVEGWVNLGSTLLSARQYADAERALATALALDKNMMAAHMLIGDAQRLQGNTKEALRSYEAAVEIERSPMALNKLACALRSHWQFAESQALYEEAIRKAPNYSLVKINLATLQIEQGNYEEASSQLDDLSKAQLPPTEKQELASAQLALGEYDRLKPAIDEVQAGGELGVLTTALSNLPKRVRDVDQGALNTIKNYMNCAKKLGKQSAEPLTDLPEDWALIEAAFMIPMVNNVDEYRAFKKEAPGTKNPGPELQATLNMVPAIEASRQCKGQLDDPASAEAHLRHWHMLTGTGLNNYHGGHFKYTQNWAAKNPTLQRVNPHQSSATFQYFMREMYPRLRPGIVRAVVSFLAACDLHCFADGNGRVMMTWLNRELEWNGLMPALFHHDISLQGDLAKARALALSADGDLAPMIAGVQKGQVFAKQFLQELAQ